ncbi:MAG: HAMP domain-containing sensor histidine kinase, partial [Sulfurovum sp.]
SDKTLIFSTLNSKDIEFGEVAYTTNNYIHFINQPESYYLGAKYIVIEILDDNIWQDKVLKHIAIYSALMFIFMSIVGYFMSKLFLKPMKDSLHLLDRFIKDTTHELNTPVSAIMQNIEMIDKSSLDEKSVKKINRIEIGAKTISNIYEDLTFLTLKNKLISQNEKLNLSNIITTRVEYFKSLAKSKKINIELDIKESVYIVTDTKKISKLIDNLLSNAIKYNKLNGTIKVILKENYFEVIDTGIGISKENLEYLFKRYTRFNTNAGGFGIGLNIVYLIAKEYNLKIDVDSNLNEGTRFKVSW